MRNKAHNKTAWITMLPLEDLEAIAAGTFPMPEGESLTPAMKRTATMTIREKKNGPTQSTPAQERARLLGQNSFFLKGMIGQLDFLQSNLGRTRPTDVPFTEMLILRADLYTVQVSLHKALDTVNKLTNMLSVHRKAPPYSAF